jgi:hypothetical protein
MTGAVPFFRALCRRGFLSSINPDARLIDTDRAALCAFRTFQRDTLLAGKLFHPNVSSGHSRHPSC